LKIDDWIGEVIARHSAELTRPELLKAIRALSARYVERRGALPERSVLDSAGKRAAFAAYYAPLHFLTVRAVLAADTALPEPAFVLDAGCGTGVTSAAWATSLNSVKSIEGIDVHPWALGEARWTWKAFGIRAKTTRADLASHLESLVSPGLPPSLKGSADHRSLGDGGKARGSIKLPPRDVSDTAIVCGWSLNELTPTTRQRAIACLLALARRGASVFVAEPIARRLVPWWDDFADAASDAGGRAGEWRFAPELPAALAELDEAAGFDREELTVRTVMFASPGDNR